MLEIINEIKKIQDIYGDQEFIDSFSLNNGTYIKITNKPICEEDIFYVNNKKIDLSVEETREKYNWFKERAFYNTLLNNSSNKCVAGSKTVKSILSVVPESLIFKGKNLNLDRMESNIKFFLEELNAYASDTLDIPYFYNLYIDKLNELRAIVKENEDLKIKPEENIYLYLDTDLDAYKKSYQLYLEKRLFLSEKSVITVNEQRLGILSYSMALNSSNKPTLASNYINVPFEIAEMFNIISKLGYKINAILNKHSTNGQKVNIIFNSDRKIISVERFLERPAREFHDYFILQEENKEDKPQVRKITAFELVPIVDEIFTRGALVNSLKQDIRSSGSALSDYLKYTGKTFTDESIVQEFVTNRDSFYEYFYRGGKTDITLPLEHTLKKIFEYNLCNIKSRKLLCTKFDYLINILIYTSRGKEKYYKMAESIKKIQENLLESKKNNVIEINTDEEFYFLAGQLLHYLSSLSEAEDKSYQDAFEYNNLRNMQQIKRTLISKHAKYGYKLPRYSEAFINQVYQEIIEYKAECVDKKNISKSHLWYYFNAGLVGKNIFYTKIEEKEEKKEGIENE